MHDRGWEGAHHWCEGLHGHGVAVRERATTTRRRMSRGRSRSPRRTRRSHSELLRTSHSALPISVSAPLPRQGLTVGFSSLATAVCTMPTRNCSYRGRRDVHDPGVPGRQQELQRRSQHRPQLRSHMGVPRFLPAGRQRRVERRTGRQCHPVKFDLSGNQGLNIFASGYPKVTLVTCPSVSTAVDTIEDARGVEQWAPVRLDGEPADPGSTSTSGRQTRRGRARAAGWTSNSSTAKASPRYSSSEVSTLQGARRPRTLGVTANRDENQQPSFPTLLSGSAGRETLRHQADGQDSCHTQVRFGLHQARSRGQKNTRGRGQPPPPPSMD